MLQDSILSEALKTLADQSPLIIVLVGGVYFFSRGEWISRRIFEEIIIQTVKNLVTELRDELQTVLTSIIRDAVKTLTAEIKEEIKEALKEAITEARANK